MAQLVSRATSADFAPAESSPRSTHAARSSATRIAVKSGAAGAAGALGAPPPEAHDGQHHSPSGTLVSPTHLGWNQRAQAPSHPIIVELRPSISCPHAPHASSAPPSATSLFSAALACVGAARRLLAAGSCAAFCPPPLPFAPSVPAAAWWAAAAAATLSFLAPAFSVDARFAGAAAPELAAAKAAAAAADAATATEAAAAAAPDADDDDNDDDAPGKALEAPCPASRGVRRAAPIEPPRRRFGVTVMRRRALDAAALVRRPAASSASISASTLARSSASSSSSLSMTVESRPSDAA